MTQVPTKQEYASKLEELFERTKSVMREKELTPDQQKNFDKLAAITASQAFKEQLDQYVDSIRDPAYEAAREFLLAHK